MEDRGSPFKESDGDHNPPSTPGETTKTSSPKNTPNDLQSPPQHNDTKSGPSGTQKVTNTLEDANKELENLKKEGKITGADIRVTIAVLKEHASLKEKVDKLKSLLGRSAKAQRETKVDLDAAQKRLNQALREIERLNQKLDKLQSRPTHCEYCVFF